MNEIWQFPSWPQFGYNASIIEAELFNCTRSFGAWEGTLMGLNPDEREALLISNIVAEVMGSFAIEGVALNHAEFQNSVVQSLIIRQVHQSERRSDRIAQMMKDARDHRRPLNAERLCHWHRLLFDGMEVENIGAWRTHDLVISKSHIAGRDEIIYRPPPPALMAQEMARFFEWLGYSTVVPPIKAALAHIYFESIHPFSDGNGRIGRAIVEFILADVPSFALSRQIMREKNAYYDALQAGRKDAGGYIDATKFVVFMLNAMEKAMQECQFDARFLLARNAYFSKYSSLMNPRSEAVLRRIFEEGRPRVLEGLAARSYLKIAKCSPATAARDLAELVHVGALTLGEARGRSTRYEIEGVW